MSQIVKKLQTGGSSPKTYGHLWVDGIDYGNSEEVYNAFANHARSQGLNQGEFYDQWLTALRNGQDVVFGNGNSVNMKPNDMSERRAGKRSGWTRFWDDTFDTRRNHFSDAIATARRFTFTPKAPKVEEPKEKSDFDTSEILLNYNDDPNKKGHRIWSKGHADNQRAIQRVTDAIAGLKDPDKSDYKFNDTLKAAYQIAVNSGMTPEEYAAAIWGRLQDNAWEGYKNPDNDNDLDWLKAFGIGIGSSQAATTSGSTGSGSGSGNNEEIILPDGRKAKRGEDGNWIYIEDSAQEEQTPRVETPQNPNNPTLISYRTAMGMKRPDLAWGLSWNGQNYSVEDINRPENKALLDRMRLVQDINERTDLSQSERLRQLQQYINIPDDFSAYADWNPGQTVEGLNFDADFGGRSVTSAGVSEYAPTTDGTRIFKYYNNGEAGSNAWGFRNPYYLVYDNTGNLKMIKGDQEADLVANAGVGNLQTPNFIENLLAYQPLEHVANVPITAGAGSLGSSRVKQTGNFRTLGENEKYKIVADQTGKKFVFNKKNKRLSEVDDASATRYLAQHKEGGKIDFNKVNAFAKGGRVVKAQKGLAGGMWNLLTGIANNTNLSGLSGSTSTNGYNPASAISSILGGKQDTSLVSNAIADHKADQLASDLAAASNRFNITTQSFHPQMSQPKVRTISQSAQEDWYGGDPNMNSTPVWISAIKGGLKAADYGVMAVGRNKIHDIAAKALKDAEFREVAPRLQGVNTATSIEDRAVQNAQQEMGKTPYGVKATSNILDAAAIQQSSWQKAANQLNQAILNQAAAAWQRQQANQQLANQQAQKDATVENQYRQRHAGTIMNLAQNDASLEAQKAQSLQNLIREDRTKFDKQINKLNQLGYNQGVTQLTDAADANWLSYLQKNHKSAWGAWSKADQSKYGNDFNTWAQATPGMWNTAISDAYNANRSKLAADVLAKYKEHMMDPVIANMYRERFGTYKSGGTLSIKQRNRYKNEPAEDIWINQNKATHKLVAKLNDNIIKTFLKTLK